MGQNVRARTAEGKGCRVPAARQRCPPCAGRCCLCSPSSFWSLCGWLPRAERCWGALRSTLSCTHLPGAASPALRRLSRGCDLPGFTPRPPRALPPPPRESQPSLLEQICFDFGLVPGAVTQCRGICAPTASRRSAHSWCHARMDRDGGCSSSSCRRLDPWSIRTPSPSGMPGWRCHIPALILQH